MNDSKSKSCFSFSAFTNPHSQTASRFYKGISSIPNSNVNVQPFHLSVSFTTLMAKICTGKLCAQNCVHKKLEKDSKEKRN